MRVEMIRNNFKLYNPHRERPPRCLRVKANELIDHVQSPEPSRSGSVRFYCGGTTTVSRLPMSVFQLVHGRIMWYTRVDYLGKNFRFRILQLG